MAKASPAKIMIVATEKTEAKEVKKILSNFGYTVTSMATSGEKALEKLKKLSKSRKIKFFGTEKPDLVLVDIGTHERMDGIEVASQIHSRFDIPVVYLTSYADKATVERAKTLAPFGYILKPLRERDVYVTIEMALYKHATEKKLIEEKERLTLFMDSIFDHFMLFDSGMNIIEVNKAALEVWGMSREEVIGKNILDMTPGIDKTLRYKKYLEVLKTGKPYFKEKIEGHPRFGDRLINVKAFKVGDGLGILVKDVTERKKAEEALQDSEKHYRLLVESMSEGLVRLDEKGVVTYLNDRFLEVIGATRDEIYGHSVLEFVDPTSQKMLEEQMRRRKKGEHGTYEVVFKRKSGGKVTVFVSPRPIFDEKGNFKGSIAVLTDITNLRLAEQELKKSREQLRKLSLHLQTIREDERKLLAHQIHDELGQLLTALKMDLSWLSQRLPKGHKEQRLLLEKTKSMSELLNKTMKSVQRISAELRPGLLDDLGLVPAMEWQAQQFEKRAKIKCEVSLDSEEVDLDQNLSTALFRVFQEALTNVARHAQATKVKVSFRERNGRLTLKIKDNGKGITQEEIQAPDSLGIVGMRERLSPWEGKIKITGTKDRGTILTVTVPLEKRSVSE